MIDIKLIRKGKPGARGATGGTGKGAGGYIGSGQTVGEAVHALRADLALEAKRADEASIAKESEYASKAGYAATAGSIADDSPVLDKFLRKDRDDRTPYGLGAKELRTAEGIRSDNFIAGINTGVGFGIDGQGNAEVESIRVRSYMEIMELITNRQTAIEGDVMLTESDTIESVTDHGDGTYTLKLHEKWEGYFTAQIEHNVLRGIFNNISSSAPTGQGTTVTNNATYYTSWMRVTAVDAANNTVDVILYPDDETPAGRNFPPEAMMKFSRWGSSGNPDDPRYAMRQECLYLSSTEGTIKKLFRVTKPILDEGNWAVSLGTLPSFLDGYMGIEPGTQGAYIDTLVANRIIKRDYSGKPVPEIDERGRWTLGEKYTDGTAPDGNGEWKRSCVSHNGHVWLSSYNGVATAENEPRWNTTYWTHRSGDVSLHLDFNEVDSLVDIANPDTPLSVKATYIGDDVTDSTAIYYDWTRESWRDGKRDTASDTLWNDNHKNFGPSAILDASDMNFAFGQPPEKLTITVTATLHDPNNPNLQPQAAEYYMI